LAIKTWVTTRKVTLSHLKSKEFLRIHLPCIPKHRESTPVYIEMYPGKVVALPKEKATFIKHELDEVCFIHAQTIIDCGNKLMLM